MQVAYFSHGSETQLALENKINMNVKYQELSRTVSALSRCYNNSSQSKIVKPSNKPNPSSHASIRAISSKVSRSVPKY